MLETMTCRLLAIALLVAVAFINTARSDWRTAEPGWEYVFPRDHGPHLEFKTEWLYFTGNLKDQKGRRFGYELTLFRQGIRPEAERSQGSSRFVVNDLKFAHFALSDVGGQRFYFQQNLSRGAFDEAGFGAADGRLAWIDDWKIGLAPDGQFHLRAKADNFTLAVTNPGRFMELMVSARKPRELDMPPIIIPARGCRAKEQSLWKGAALRLPGKAGLITNGPPINLRPIK